MRHIDIFHIVFSPHGNTKKIAHHVQTLVGGQLLDATLPPSRTKIPLDFDSLFVYVPVYSATIPKPLIPLFAKIKTRQLVIIATHGGMTQGRVWSDVARLIDYQHLLGLFSIPQKHTYKNETVSADLSKFHPFAQLYKTNQLKPLAVPKEKAYRIARLSEPLRTAFNVRITINHARCNRCMQCIAACPTNAIGTALTISNTCIHCVRCVAVCPENAILYAQSRFLKRYLRHVKEPKVRSIYRSI